MPVPVIKALCGEPAALSEKLTLAEREPTADGVNVIISEQEALGATFVPFLQVLAADSVKSEGFVPLITGALESVSVEPPVFVTVSVDAALVVDIVWMPKETLGGENVTACPCAKGIKTRAASARMYALISLDFLSGSHPICVSLMRPL